MELLQFVIIALYQMLLQTQKQKRKKDKVRKPLYPFYINRLGTFYEFVLIVIKTNSLRLIILLSNEVYYVFFVFSWIITKYFNMFTIINSKHFFIRVRYSIINLFSHKVWSYSICFRIYN